VFCPYHSCCRCPVYTGFKDIYTKRTKGEMFAELDSFSIILSQVFREEFKHGIVLPPDLAHGIYKCALY